MVSRIMAQYRDHVDNAEELLEALKGPEVPSAKRRRLAEAGRARCELWSSFRHLLDYLVAQEGREPKVKKIKNFQMRQGMQFYKLMAVLKDSKLKERVRGDFEWVISDEFTEFFAKKWKEVADTV